MSSDACKKCDDEYEKCKKKAKCSSIQIFSPIEILGWAAIVLGLIGGFHQLRKSGGSKDLRSFSFIYLITATIAELLFLIQGLLIKNVSITVTRFATMIYFGSFLVMWLIYERGRKH